MFGEPHLHIHIIFPRSHTFCPAHHRNNLPEPEKLQTDICRFKKNKGSSTTGYVFIFLKRLLWLLVYLISSYPIFYWCVTNQAKWLSGFPWLFFFFSFLASSTSWRKKKKTCLPEIQIKQHLSSHLSGSWSYFQALELEEDITSVLCLRWTISCLEMRPGAHRLGWETSRKEPLGSWFCTGNFKKGAGECGLLNPCPGSFALFGNTLTSIQMAACWNFISSFQSPFPTGIKVPHNGAGFLERFVSCSW